MDREGIKKAFITFKQRGDNLARMKKFKDFYKVSYEELASLLAIDRFHIRFQSQKDEQHFLDCILSFFEDERNAYGINDMEDRNNFKDDFRFKFQRKLIYDIIERPEKYNIPQSERMSFKEYCEVKHIVDMPYEGQFQELNSYLENLEVDFLERGNGDVPYIMEREDQVFLFGFFQAVVGYMQWDKFKKIFRPTQLLEQDLMAQNSITLTPRGLRNLPLKNFYVDAGNTSLNKRYGIEGAMVRIVEYNGDFALTMFMFQNNDGSPFCMPYTRLPAITEEGWEVTMEGLKILYPSFPSDEGGISASKLNRLAYISRKMIFFIAGIIKYLCCTNAIRKPVRYISDFPIESGHKNPSVEYEAEDVGFTENDLIVRDIDGNGESVEEIEYRIAGLGKGGRKLPKPHFVSGHPSHVWCGKGRTIYKEVYINPYRTRENPYYVSSVSITNMKKAKGKEG